MDIQTFANLSLAELQAAYAEGRSGPVEAVETTFAQIEAVNGPLNALYDLRRDIALTEARAAQERLDRGQPIGPFDGVPVTIKDSVNAVGMTWFHGSAIHGKGRVATGDAPPAERLKAAGAIIVGKGIMPDFGLSASGVSGSHGIVRNPWGMAWNTGGSSAGAGASLAAGIAMMSVGSDIAGSVRLPASHCGLAALKPTQGAIPHAPASTVRSAGPMTRRAADLRAWTQLLGGPHEADRHSVPLIEGPAPLRAGASCDFGFGPALEPAVRECFERVRDVLADLVGEVADVTKRADFDAYLPIDASLKLKGWLEYAGASPEMREHAPAQLVEWFAEAEGWSVGKLAEIDAGIERGVGFTRDLMDGLDVLLTPVMPVVNFPAEARGIDPAMPLRHTTFTAPFNQSGHPAVSICGGFDARGLPIGMQLVGHRFGDLALVDLAARLEAALGLIGSGARPWPTTPQS